MYINYSGSQIIYGELILYLAEQYLLLHKDRRFRSGGVLFFIFILSFFFFFAGVLLDSSSHFPVSSVLSVFRL